MASQFELIATSLRPTRTSTPQPHEDPTAARRDVVHPQAAEASQASTPLGRVDDDDDEPAVGG